jgi:hypothetical protein
MRQRRIVTLLRILTSRLRENRGLFLPPTIRSTGEEASLRSPLRSSPDSSSYSRQATSTELCGRSGWSTRYLSSGNSGYLQRNFALELLRQRLAASTLQTTAVVESQFSRTFPAHPRSLASVLIPRPAALRLLLFPDSSPNQMRWVPTPENAPSALGSGAHSHPTTHRSCVGDPGISRRFAQECPEGNTGKSNKEN